MTEKLIITMTSYVKPLSEAFIKDRLLIAMQYDNYAGYDPFDGLNSKLFTTLKLDKVPFFRLVWLQLHKRLPINLRPLVDVPKERNPKGIALVILGLIEEYRHTKAPYYLTEAIQLGDWLLKKTSDKQQWQHHCWGYNFPWQARAFYVPAGKPNIITTCYVARALFDLADVSGDLRYQDAAIDAGRFIGSLFRQQNGREYFVYIPGETTFIHNASLWGAAVASQAGAVSADRELLDKARRAVKQSAKEQATDGSWVYGERTHHQFIDSFHTGYNLEAIWWYQQHTRERQFDGMLKKGLAYYKAHFFLEDGTPKYYNNAVYPVDMHCVAQSVFTLMRVGGTEEDRQLVKKVLDWSIKHMFMLRKNTFRYQKTSKTVNNVCYLRWTQAWMYYALSYQCNTMA